MDKFLIKRPMNSDDESAIETKVRKVSEMSSDVKTSRKVNKKDRKYQDSYIKFGFIFDVEADLKVAVSNIKLNIESIMSTMQAQVSH